MPGFCKSKLEAFSAYNLQLKVNFALIIMKYTVHLPFYLTQLSLLLRAVNKLCLQLSVKDSVVSNIMVGELYISLYLEQNSPLVLKHCSPWLTLEGWKFFRLVLMYHIYWIKRLKEECHLLCKLVHHVTIWLYQNCSIGVLR